MQLKRAWIVVMLGSLLASCARESQPPPTPPAPAPDAAQSQPAADEAPDLPLEPEMVQRLLQPWRGDFDAMVDRRTIRVLVPYSRTFFQIDGADQKGFAVDIMREFERVVNERVGDKTRPLRIGLIAVRRDELLTFLAAGRGDLALGNITVTPERQKLVDFANPMITDAREIVVTGRAAPAVASLDDLAGREVYVRKSSSYYEHLARVNADFRKAGKPPVVVNTVDEQLEDEDLLEMVNAGAIPAIVVDRHIAEPWAKALPDIVLNDAAEVNSGGRIAWAIRKDCPALTEVVNAFVADHGIGTTFGNMMVARYLKDTKYIRNSTSEAEMQKLRAAIDLFKKYGAQYDFDWLLVAAQAYQESGIDQGVRSPVGAVGVMQVLPSTAAGNPINIPGVDADMDKNIHAGVKYMRFMMDEYFKDAHMDNVNKCLFAFASYNAGPAKVAKLRKEAADRGLDPDKWFQNVELIAAQRIGRETTTYVSNIYKYYVAFRLSMRSEQAKRAAEAKLAGVTP
jgi:membrane-bound lytic murein transglycosylase MltF